MPKNAKTAAARENLERIATILGLIGNPTRLHLLSIADGTKTVEDLATEVGFSMSAVSQHLCKTKPYGLAAPARDRQMMYWKADKEAIREALLSACDILGITL
jgi:DNA-binding transcriptional ArsR family regulator